jgi:hypothetical protein
LTTLITYFDLLSILIIVINDNDEVVSIVFDWQKLEKLKVWIDLDRFMALVKPAKGIKQELTEE